MKKIIIIFFIFVIHSNIAKAANDAAGFESNIIFKNKVSYFNKWLYDNNHHQYLNFEEEENNCKELKKYGSMWYYRECNLFEGSNNLEITFFAL